MEEKTELFPNMAGLNKDEDPTAQSKPEESPGVNDTSGVGDVGLTEAEVVDVLVDMPCRACDQAVEFGADPVCVCSECGDAWHAKCYQAEHGVTDVTDEVVCAACCQALAVGPGRYCSPRHRDAFEPRFLE